MSIDNHAIDVTIHLAVVHEPLVDMHMAELLDECPDGQDMLPVHRVADRHLEDARHYLHRLPVEVLADMVLVAMSDNARDDAKERLAALAERLVVDGSGHVVAAPQCPQPELHATYHRRSETHRRQVAAGVAVPSVPGICDWCDKPIAGGAP